MLYFSACKETESNATRQIRNKLNRQYISKLQVTAEVAAGSPSLTHALFLASCVVPLFHIHLTLKHQPSTLLSLVNGSPRPTAFITEILCCQVALYTCHRGLKGTAPDPLLHNAMILHCLTLDPFSPLFSAVCQHNSFPRV